MLPENIKSDYFSRYNMFKKNFPELKTYELEKLVEHTMCTNLKNDFDSINKWVEIAMNKFDTELIEVPINELDSWNIDENKISHSSGKFFEILGLRISENSGREINSGWDQPIVKENNFDGGVLGLLRTHIDGLPHYLVQTRFEPGNYGSIQISPTLQATFSNLNQEHGGRKPHYYEFFENFENNKGNFVFNAWLSEDGGKFYFKRNRGLVKQVPYDDTYLVDENFKWVSLFQVKKLMKSNSLVNPHLARLIFL